MYETPNRSKYRTIATTDSLQKVEMLADDI